MAGVIDSTVNGTQAIPVAGKMQTAGVSNYDPETRSIDAAKETVSGQLDSLLAKDSPLSQRAMAGSVQQSNRRGLVNSSMAAQAGQAALIDAATPIANADANVYGAASKDNQAAKNTAYQFNAGEENRANLFNAGQANDLQKVNQQGEIEKGLINERGIEERLTDTQAQEAQTALTTQQGEENRLTVTAQGEETRLTADTNIKGEKDAATAKAITDTALQTLRGTQAQDLADTEAEYKGLMQASSSAASLFTTTQQQIAAILNDTKTSAEQKQSAVSSLTAGLKSGLSIIGSIGNLNLGELLDFSGITGPAAAPPAPAPAPAAAPTFQNYGYDPSNLGSPG